MIEIKDFLGSEIKIGLKGIRVHSSGHLKDFKKIEVKEIDITRHYGDSIGILTDGNKKIGWTYPNRIIVESSFKQGILDV